MLNIAFNVNLKFAKRTRHTDEVVPGSFLELLACHAFRFREEQKQSQ